MPAASARAPAGPDPAAPRRAPRASLVLVCLLATAGPAEARPLPPAVTIDTRDVDRADLQTLNLVGLASKLALRLGQAGYAVVGRQHSPLIAIFLRAARPAGRPGAAPRLEIRVASAQHWRRRGVVRGERSMATFHLEALKQALAATREVEAQLRAALVRRPISPAPAPKKPPALTAKGGGADESRWDDPRYEVGFQVLALVRGGGADPLFRLGGRARPWSTPLGLRWSLRYSLSSVEERGDELSISEWGVELGADWRLHLSSDRRFRLDLGLLAGFSAHRYSFGPLGADEETASGTRWDLSASAFAQLGLRVTRRLGLVVWLAGGLAEDEREHRIEGRAAPLWRRARLRLEAGGGLRFAI